MTIENDTIRDEDLGETVERAVDGIVGIGRLWAVHGLNIGRSALETSAATLKITAGVLGDISQRFRDAKTTEPEPALEEPEPEVVEDAA